MLWAAFQGGEQHRVQVTLQLLGSHT
jgi:hypothetical protein